MLFDPFWSPRYSIPKSLTPLFGWGVSMVKFRLSSFGGAGDLRWRATFILKNTRCEKPGDINDSSIQWDELKVWISVRVPLQELERPLRPYPRKSSPFGTCFPSNWSQWLPFAGPIESHDNHQKQVCSNPYKADYSWMEFGHFTSFYHFIYPVSPPTVIIWGGSNHNGPQSNRVFSTPNVQSTSATSITEARGFPRHVWSSYQFRFTIKSHGNPMKNHHEFPSNHHEYPMKFHEIPWKSRVSWWYPWFFRTLRGAPRLRGVRPPSHGVGQDTPLPEERFGRRCFRGCSPNMFSMLDDVGYTRMLNKVFPPNNCLISSVSSVQIKLLRRRPRVRVYPHREC